MSDASREAAAAIIGDVAEESEQPTDTAAEEVQHEAEEELPEDIQELLAQPDLDEEEEEEDYTQEGESTEEYLEPEAAEKLRRRAAKAERKAAFLEDLRVKSETKKWKAEATKYFKYADPETIQAKSRRSFLSQAKEQHESIKGRVEKILADERAKDEAETAQLRADNRQTARDAWGQPVATHGQTPTHVEAGERRESSLRAGKFTDAVRARLSDPEDPVFKALS